MKLLPAAATILFFALFATPALAAFMGPCAVGILDPSTGEMTEYVTDSHVWCVASGRSLPRIAAGLESGEVLILDVEPNASSGLSGTDS